MITFLQDLSNLQKIFRKFANGFQNLICFHDNTRYQKIIVEFLSKFTWFSRVPRQLFSTTRCIFYDAFIYEKIFLVSINRKPSINLNRNKTFVLKKKEFEKISKFQSGSLISNSFLKFDIFVLSICNIYINKNKFSEIIFCSIEPGIFNFFWGHQGTSFNFEKYFIWFQSWWSW